MKLHQFKKMISKKEFKPVDLSQFESMQEFEVMNEFGQNQYLFEDLEKELGRPPTHMEFIRSHEKTISDFFLNSPKSNLEWNKQLAQAVAVRMGRMYMSQLVEYSTVLRIKELFPHMEVGVNKHLDNVGGVDIAVSDPTTNKVTYIHIIAESRNARNSLEGKWFKRGCLSTGDIKRYFKRSPNKKNHMVLAYSYYADHTTEYVNGIPVLKAEYVRTEVLKGLEKSEETWESPGELAVFHNWLQQNGVREGLSGMAQ